ncbi:MAG: glycosyltransferase [Anaerolineae bacterium]
MRIFMVSHGYPPILSGVTLVVQKIARAMVRKGHEVVVVTASEHGEPYEDRDQGVRLIRVRSASNPFWDDGPIPFLSQSDLDEMVGEFDPHVLHAHDAAILGLQLLRLNQKQDLPHLATAYYVPRFVARYLTWNEEPQEVVESLFWAYSTWLFNRFDHVVFATQAHRDRFLKRDLDVPTSIISNGIDTSRYRPLNDHTEDLQTKYELPPGPRILFVSRLAQDKEIDVLIQAMQHIRARGQAHLLLVGEGDNRDELERLTQESDLEDCLHFLGFVPEEDLPALYRASDLFAIASTCEVQSLPTLQAVATGLPVVAADAVALPELVHDGINGFLVPPGDPEAMANAIGHILADRSLAAQMGQASLSIAQPHAEERTFEAYENLCLRLVNRQFAHHPQQSRRSGGRAHHGRLHPGRRRSGGLRGPVADRIGTGRHRPGADHAAWSGLC